MKLLLLTVLSAALPLAAQVDPLEGVWQGYDGELLHVSRQVIALAEKIPAETYAYRPAPGVRSTAEVFMHIVSANYGLLSRTGPKLPPAVEVPNFEQSVTAKAEVIDWLKRSFEAVKIEHPKVKHADFARKVKIGKYTGTVDGIYLRILVHANEHMGQLVAYARVNGIVPPWSETPAK